jgi:hypothetical protein
MPGNPTAQEFVTPRAAVIAWIPFMLNPRYMLAHGSLNVKFPWQSERVPRTPF